MKVGMWEEEDKKVINMVTEIEMAKHGRKVRVSGP